jgi:hypothetical protein
VLESLALDEAPPPLEDSAVGDPTLPAWEEEAGEEADAEEAEAVAARMAAILGFKVRRAACALPDAGLQAQLRGQRSGVGRC